MEAIDLDKFSGFFDKYIKGKKFAFLIIGKKGDVDMNTLAQLGTVKELTLEEVFGY